MTRRGVVTLGEQLGVLRTAGPMELATDAAVGIGGAEGNVAIGLARLGTPVVWAGRVGDDALGRRAVTTLAGQGVDVRVVVDADAPTGLILKEAPVPGRTRVVYHRAGSAGSRLSPADITDVPIEDAALLHVTGVTLAISDTARATVHAAIERARAAGVAIAFDVNHRTSLWSAADAAPHYREVAAAADLVFAGDDEAAILAPDAGTDPAALLAALASFGPTVAAVLKRGHLGAIATQAGRTASVAAVAVDVVDTVGAGDAFVAGFLAEHLASADLDDALATAARCGALACTTAGDWEGAPRRADLALLDGDPVVR